MIKKIEIKNFAIIDKLIAEFHEGFNVITGETGSGKSLIINAIDILFGAELNNEMLRDKEKPLEVSAVFNIKNKEIKISRIYMNKKSHSFINNAKTSKSEIIKQFSHFVQFQKQHDSNRLLNSNKHIEFLDAYALNDHDLLTMYKFYLEYVNSKKNYENFLENDLIYKDKFNLYKYQIEELNSIKLDSSEEAIINKEYGKQINSKKIRDIITSYNNRNETSDFSPKFNVEKLLKSLSKYKDLDSDIEEVISRFENIIIELKDIDDEMNNIEKKYYFNPNELEILEEKLQKYEEIKRKYGGTIQSSIDYKNKIKHELNEMAPFDDKIESLKKIFLENKSKYKEKALEISKIRKDSAIMMSKKINEYLISMDMPEAQIKIGINDSEVYKENGIDSCEFFGITNKGEDYKPIKQIASGGEISRIMLSMNLVTQKASSLNTLIFDEVDTGISGSTASNMGFLLKELSKSRQLIIVTHLPQIASKSDKHIITYKTKKDNRSLSMVKTLAENEHRLEIARMLSGKKITEHSIKQAKEMIANG